MDPIAVAAAPMTFTSPSFVLLVLTIIGIVAIFYIAFSTIAKSSADTAPYDSARTLVNTALIMFCLVFVYVAGIVAYQVFMSGTGSASTEAWGQLCLFIGWVLGTATTIYNQRFGTTKTSAEKDATAAQQARTNAVITDALLNPAVVISGTGAGGARAAMVDLAMHQPADGSAPIQAGDVNIVAASATVSELDPKEQKP